MKSQLSELLSAYLDGELDERDTRRAKEVLQKDAAARRLLEELRRNRELLVSLPRHEAPASIQLDVQAFVERSALLDDLHSTSDANVLRVFRRLVPLAMAASLAFVAVGGWWYYRRDLRPMRNATESAGVRESLSDSAATRGRDLTAPPDVLLADSRPLDAKLAAGAGLPELQTHRFANEPLRLEVVVENERQQREIAGQLASQLASASLTDLEKVTASPSLARQQPAQSGFYLQGRAGVNYSPARESQILVRAPASQAARIVDQLPPVAGKDPQIELQAGALAVKGRRQSRDVLDALARGGNEGETEAAAPPSGPIPGTSPAGRRPEMAPSTSRGRSPQPETVADADDRPAEQQFLDELLGNIGIDLDSFGSKKPAKDEDATLAERPGNLVESRKKVLAQRDERADKTADASFARGVPESTAPFPTRSSGEAAPENRFVTFVIQIKTKDEASPTPASNPPPAVPPNARAKPNGPMNK